MTKRQAEAEEHRRHYVIGGNPGSVWKKSQNRICGERINIVTDEDAPELWDKNEATTTMRQVRQNRNCR